MCVGQPLAGYPILGNDATACVAQAAGLDLLAQTCRGDPAHCVAGPRIDRPRDIVTFVEGDRQALVGIIALPERPPALLFVCPGDMSRALSMACLASDADLSRRCGITGVLGVVILANAGRMAFRTHEIPILVQLGPVQDIVMLDLLVRIEMKPALATFLLWPAVPGDRQRLQTAVGKRN